MKLKLTNLFHNTRANVSCEADRHGYLANFMDWARAMIRLKADGPSVYDTRLVIKGNQYRIDYWVSDERGFPDRDGKFVRVIIIKEDRDGGYE